MPAMTVRRARRASRFTVAQLNFRRESLRKLSAGARGANANAKKYGRCDICHGNWILALFAAGDPGDGCYRLERALRRSTPTRTIASWPGKPRPEKIPRTAPIRRGRSATTQWGPISRPMRWPRPRSRRHDDGSRRRSAHLKQRGLIIGACARIGRTLDFAERVNAGDQPRTARFFLDWSPRPGAHCRASFYDGGERARGRSPVGRLYGPSSFRPCPR